MGEKLPDTRENDFDKEFIYALFDEYMSIAESGEITHEEAIELYRKKYNEYVLGLTVVYKPNNS